MQYDLGQAQTVGEGGTGSGPFGLVAVELGLPMARADGLLGLDFLARFQVVVVGGVGRGRARVEAGGIGGLGPCPACAGQLPGPAARSPAQTAAGPSGGPCVASLTAASGPVRPTRQSGPGDPDFGLALSLCPQCHIL